MTIAITEESADCSKLVVNGALTIYDAVAAKAVLIDALAKTGEIEIDLAGVEEIDTAGLQLLILVKREAVRAGKNMRLFQHSAASLEVLDRYNLASYFGDPVVISSGTS